VVEQGVTLSNVFDSKSRLEVLTDFNYEYLMGSMEYYVNFRSQFYVLESDDSFRIYKPTTDESFEQISQKYFGVGDYAIEIASYNNLSIGSKIPSVLLIPTESMNLNIVNKMMDVVPPYSLERVKNELLGFDLKLTDDKDFMITANGDLDLMFGDIAVVEAISDILSTPQGSFLADPTLGNPIPPSGELPNQIQIMENSVMLESQILKDPRILSADFQSMAQDGDVILYEYKVKTISDSVFNLEVF